MRHISTQVLLAAGCVSMFSGSVLGAVGDINSVVPQLRIFNDFGGSTLTVTDNDLTSFVIEETDFIPDGGADWANRHAAYLSSDDTNPYAFQNDESFDFSVDLTLEVGSTSTVKEVGIYMETYLGGQGQFIIKPDGEIAAFGQFPFVSSTADDGDGPEFDGRTYTAGDTVNLRIIYTPGDGSGGSTPATMEFLVDGVSSGPREFANSENGVISGSSVGVYAQYPPDIFAFPIDYAVMTAENWTVSGGGSGLVGDFNTDGVIDASDIDLLAAAIRTGSSDAAYDLDAQNGVDAADLTVLVEDVLGKAFGDANLDGNVDLLDLSLLASNFEAGAGWSGGNFNTDTTVDLLDLSILASNFGTTSAVPEPTSVALLGLAGLGFIRRR